MAFLKSVHFGGSAANATDHENLLLKLVQFVCGVGYPTFSGTGGVRARYARGRASAVSETWTITCTNAGAGTFSVVGSVSGAQASATVGTPYDNGKIAFTLTNLTGAAVLSDVVTVDTVAGTLATAGQCWELIKVSTAVASETHVFLRGLGLAGTDQIYVALRTYQAADIYNLELYGGTGYLESNILASSMPGGNGGTLNLCLYNTSLPYVFIANGRRFELIVKVSTVYECGYAGFILPSGTPSEYPYPLAIGGSHSSQGRRWSDTQSTGIYGSYHRAFFNPHGTLVVRDKGGTWMTFANYTYSSSESVILAAAQTNCTSPFRDLVPGTTIEGGYVLYPVSLHTSSPANNVLGDFEGVYQISGSSNLSENIAQVGGVDHLVIQNTYHSDIGDYAAFKLE